MSSDSPTGQAPEARKTPLYSCHQNCAAKFTEFGGWDMPVQYSGLVDEHHTVRNAVGLFDVSHMGELVVKGGDALAYLQHVTSNDVSKLSPGEAQYSLLLNEKGGVVDDIIVYRLAESDYLLCVNAANTEKDFNWLKAQCDHDISLENVSSHFVQIAVQGPKARVLVQEMIGVSASEYSAQSFPAFTFRTEKVALDAGDLSLLVACTGYTGEDGFEIFCEASRGAELWQTLVSLGQKYGLKPIGLGARDTLRLEVCYPLHGHELRDDLCALSCGVGWVIKMKKGDFIGRDALLREKEQGVALKLVGLEVEGRGIIRADAKLYQGEREVGWVSSGTKPPTVNKAVGLGFLPPELSTLGTQIEAEVRGKRLPLKVIGRPFYKRAT